MNKEDALKTLRNYMGNTPKNYEWYVVTTGNEHPEDLEITLGLTKKEK